jgi:hypothetical protein
MLRAIAEMSYLWRRTHALDGARLAARVGPLPATSPRQAMRQALLDLGLAPAARRDEAGLRADGAAATRS